MERAGGSWIPTATCSGLPAELRLPARPSLPCSFWRRPTWWLPDPAGEYAQAYAFQELPMEQRTAAPVNFLAVNLIRAFGKDAWYANWARIALAKSAERASTRSPTGPTGNAPARPAFPSSISSDSGSGRRRSSIVTSPTSTIPALKHKPRRWRGPWLTQRCPAPYRLLFAERSDVVLYGGVAGRGHAVYDGHVYTRAALAEHLRRKYATDQALSQAWGMQVTFDRVARSRWSGPLTGNAKRELESFSTSMVKRLYGTISKGVQEGRPEPLEPRHPFPGRASGTVDRRHPEHRRCLQRELLQAAVPRFLPRHQRHTRDAGDDRRAGLRRPRRRTPRSRQSAGAHAGGSWPGIPLSTRKARSPIPAAFGSHYFRLYDNPALGRPDGENYNIGFLDICNRPYEPLVSAARQTHGRQYRVASGAERPYDDAPDYLGL